MHVVLGLVWTCLSSYLIDGLAGVKSNPLFLPRIPPNPVFRDLPATRKFQGVGKRECGRKKNGFGWEEKLPKEACHPDNDRDPLACRKSPESGGGSGDSESDEFLISGGDREGRSHRDKA